MMGCWGGVLAAAVCPHTGCETTTTAPAAGEASATHGDHGPACDKVVIPEDHSGHVSAHEGHAGKPDNGDQQQFSPVGLHTIVPKQHDQFCSHCMGRPEAPPSPYSEWQSNSARRAGSYAAPIAAVQVESPTPVYLRLITPAQHAPPGTSDRHLLLNVFRI
jgi:hypothetical protein